MMLDKKIFQTALITWQKTQGRNDLPWQHPRSAYHVWLSEVMLQQTQVKTVIPYFQRFIAHFPDITTLAKAELEYVTPFWAGLGYYARIRNLHRSARIIQTRYCGQFPKTLKQLQELPGIGRSTAGAILSLAFNQSAPILDGNVKRILTRLHGISGWPGLAKVNKQLWDLAQYYLPQHDCAQYTQALMDLGALVCTKDLPKCTQCPLHDHCYAYTQNNPEDYPTPPPKKIIPIRETTILILLNKDEVLLEKRPPVGIWGGLWSPPEYHQEQPLEDFCREKLFCQIKSARLNSQILNHRLTHLQLKIKPFILEIENWSPPLMESNRLTWHNKRLISQLALATPIRKLLEGL